MKYSLGLLVGINPSMFCVADDQLFTEIIFFLLHAARIYLTNEIKFITGMRGEVKFAIPGLWVLKK